MIKKTTRLTLEIFMAVITVVLLCLAVFFWRLSQGPMEIDSLKQQIEKSLGALSNDIDIRIEKVFLQWGGVEHPLVIHMSDIDILNRLGGEVAQINDVSVSLSLTDLLIGRFAPTDITIMKPSFTVTRNQQGQFDINVKSKRDSEYETQQNLGNDPLEEILTLLAEPNRQGVARKLETLKITQSEIFYQDMPNNFTLISPQSDIELRRDDEGVEGVLTLNVKIADQTKALRGKINYNFSDQKTKISLATDQINPKIFASLSSNFQNAKNFDIPLKGTLHVSLNHLLQVLSFDLVAKGGEGFLAIPHFYQEPIALEGADLDISYNPSDGSIFMRQFALDIDGFRVDVQGRLTQSIDDSVVKLKAKAGLFNIGADQLKTYWPEKLASNAQNWVTQNISNGIVSKATADLELSAPLTDISLVRIDHLQGNLFYNDLIVDYLKPLPAVTQVSGTANYTKDHFTLNVENGEVFDTTLNEGLIKITGFSQPMKKIAIDLNLNGPLEDGLNIISQDPLTLTDNIGFKPDGLSGQAVTSLSLEFPLKKTLKKSEVNVRTQVQLSNVTGDQIITNGSLYADSLSLIADNNQMRVQGKAKLNTIPIDLDWIENFGQNADLKRQMKAIGQVNAKQVKNLTNIDLSSYIMSPFQASAVIKETRAGQQSTTIDLDLKNTALSMPEIHYMKNAGEEARLTFEIVDNEQNQNITDLKNISLVAPDFFAAGEAQFKDSNLVSATIGRFKHDKTDIAITITKETNRYKSVLKGKTLDLSNFWKARGQKKQSQQEETSDNLSQSYFPILLTMDVEQLILHDQHPFQNVQSVFEFKPDRLHRLEVDARAGKGDVYLRYKPFENGQGYELRFETPDAGAALNAFDLTSKIKEGTMIIDAATAVDNTKKLIGGLTIKNFKVVQAPVLGRLINALSPAGLLELLDNDGLQFLQLESKWSYQDEILNFETGRMAGSSLGLNYQGLINTGANYMDIKGTIVPVNPVNRVIGTLPVVGQILGGAKGEGLFAATYEVKGAVDNPKVTVNPLAALAPGILRSIFFENDL